MLLGCFWLFGALMVLIFSLFYFKKSSNWGVNYILLWGKLKEYETRNVIARTLEIPKRWFFHFYLLGALVNTFAAVIFWNIYINGGTPPVYLMKLDGYLHIKDAHSIDGNTAILLVVMMLLQNLRRLYECWFVSVYSRGTMNVLHYGAGLLLYATFHIVVMVEAPPIQNYASYTGGRFNVTWWQTFGLTLFLWSSWQQHQIHQDLASLRKNKRGDIVTYQHGIPQGGWFEVVSSPHYLMEMLVYTAFGCLTGFIHLTLLCVILFVYTNQLVAAYISHVWYKQHFPTYPTRRKAVLPYLF